MERLIEVLNTFLAFLVIVSIFVLTGFIAFYRGKEAK
jgi:hypothetical protein